MKLQILAPKHYARSFDMYLWQKWLHNSSKLHMMRKRVKDTRNILRIQDFLSKETSKERTVKINLDVAFTVTNICLSYSRQSICYSTFKILYWHTVNFEWTYSILDKYDASVDEWQIKRLSIHKSYKSIQISMNRKNKTQNS